MSTPESELIDSSEIPPNEPTPPLEAAITFTSTNLESTTPKLPSIDSSPQPQLSSTSTFTYQNLSSPPSNPTAPASTARRMEGTIAHPIFHGKKGEDPDEYLEDLEVFVSSAGDNLLKVAFRSGKLNAESQLKKETIFKDIQSAIVAATTLISKPSIFDKQTATDNTDEPRKNTTPAATAPPPYIVGSPTTFPANPFDAKAASQARATCYNCTEPGHISSTCPHPRASPQMIDQVRAARYQNNTTYQTPVAPPAVAVHTVDLIPPPPGPAQWIPHVLQNPARMPPATPPVATQTTTGIQPSTSDQKSYVASPVLLQRVQHKVRTQTAEIDYSSKGINAEPRIAEIEDEHFTAQTLNTAQEKADIPSSITIAPKTYADAGVQSSNSPGPVLIDRSTGPNPLELPSLHLATTLLEAPEASMPGLQTKTARTAEKPKDSISIKIMGEKNIPRFDFGEFLCNVNVTIKGIQFLDRFPQQRGQLAHYLQNANSSRKDGRLLAIAITAVGSAPEVLDEGLSNPDTTKNFFVAVHLDRVLFVTLVPGADPAKQYHLACDASKTGIGGVLFQLKDAKPGTQATGGLKDDLKIIMFIFFKLTNVETRYTTTERKALAVEQTMRMAKSRDGWTGSQNTTLRYIIEQGNQTFSIADGLSRLLCNLQDEPTRFDSERLAFTPCLEPKTQPATAAHDEIKPGDQF
ncbi:hypothetical protein DSL72_008104 [Monilinia vaccinii-corymbosi]|uniref:CCHC-type domain-containing protein n=1 Tax=Monilinia vaccinii-corymbosi TaxID=61207 RepID=A0A8A3PJP7_9HELO|nr:hypothetical protein DSL72_008104 [Monilinia vaccinii-corymbosi]